MENLSKIRASSSSAKSSSSSTSSSSAAAATGGSQSTSPASSFMSSRSCDSIYSVQKAKINPKLPSMPNAAANLLNPSLNTKKQLPLVRNRDGTVTAASKKEIMTHHQWVIYFDPFRMSIFCLFESVWAMLKRTIDNYSITTCASKQGHAHLSIEYIVLMLLKRHRNVIVIQCPWKNRMRNNKTKTKKKWHCNETNWEETTRNETKQSESFVKQLSTKLRKSIKLSNSTVSAGRAYYAIAIRPWSSADSQSHFSMRCGDDAFKCTFG